MGTSMAGHLLDADYPVRVFNRTPLKAESLIAKGAVLAESIADLAAESDVVVSIVGFPKDVEEIYLGKAGIIANAPFGAILIDMTTSRPDLAIKIHKDASARKIASLDAPVSGGDIGAREARLSIMVGGEEDVFNQVKPLFAVMGKNIVYQGNPGSGQFTKMCNQIAIASGMLGICEAMAYAEKSGLDPTLVLKSIESGAAGSWSLSNLAPRMLKGDFAPGFFVKHFIKDMGIAAESAGAMNLEIPGLLLAKAQYEKLAEQGGADDGTQALYKLYE